MRFKFIISIFLFALIKTSYSILYPQCVCTYYSTNGTPTTYYTQGYHPSGSYSQKHPAFEQSAFGSSGIMDLPSEKPISSGSYGAPAPSNSGYQGSPSSYYQSSQTSGHQYALPTQGYRPSGSYSQQSFYNRPYASGYQTGYYFPGLYSGAPAPSTSGYQGTTTSSSYQGFPSTSSIVRPPPVIFAQNRPSALGVQEVPSLTSHQETPTATSYMESPKVTYIQSGSSTSDYQKSPSATSYQGPSSTYSYMEAPSVTYVQSGSSTSGFQGAPTPNSEPAAPSTSSSSSFVGASSVSYANGESNGSSFQETPSTSPVMNLPSVNYENNESQSEQSSSGYEVFNTFSHPLFENGLFSIPPLDPLPSLEPLPEATSLDNIKIRNALTVKFNIGKTAIRIQSFMNGKPNNECVKIAFRSLEDLIHYTIDNLNNCASPSVLLRAAEECGQSIIDISNVSLENITSNAQVCISATN